MKESDEGLCRKQPNTRYWRISTLLAAILLVVVAFSCRSTYRSMSVEEKQSFLIELEDETLAELLEKHPEVQADIERAVGYAIFSEKATKVPFVGAGNGIGVAVNKETGERTYLEVTRFDVGGGLGVHGYRVVVVFFEEAALKKLASGKLEFGAEVEAGAKEQAIETGAGGVAGSPKQGYTVYQLFEAGVSATWTVQMIRYSVLDLEG